MKRIDSGQRLRSQLPVGALIQIGFCFSRFRKRTLDADVRCGSNPEVGNRLCDVCFAPNSVAKLGAPVRWRKFVESDFVLRSLLKTNFVFVGG